MLKPLSMCGIRSFLYTKSNIRSRTRCAREAHSLTLGRTFSSHHSFLSRLTTRCSFTTRFSGQYFCTVQAIRPYAHSGSSYYDLFGKGKPGNKEFKKPWQEAGEDTKIWGGSDDDECSRRNSRSHLKDEFRNVNKQGNGNIRKAWEETDDDTGLWTGSDEDEDTTKKSRSRQSDKPGYKKFGKARKETGGDTSLWEGSDGDEGFRRKSPSHLQDEIRKFDGKRGNGKFRIAREKTDDDSGLWSESDDDEDTTKKSQNRRIDNTKIKAEEEEDYYDSGSDELRSVWSGSDEEKTLWTGSEGDDDDDIPTAPIPHERSDAYLDKLFEFDEVPKFRTIEEVYRNEEREELNPGKQARKLAVENALKKLKKGPDGRYINVAEVASDIDILIGAFENIVSGPEYAELREGGPKKLNLQYFKDIQARMRDPNFKFTPELKLKPKSKLVSRKKWMKAQARIRRAEKR